jgi:hypothetical protein
MEHHSLDQRVSHARVCHQKKKKKKKTRRRGQKRKKQQKKAAAVVVVEVAVLVLRSDPRPARLNTTHANQ